MLSEHVISLFGRSITITRTEQFVAIAAIVAIASAWAVMQFRRRRVVILQRSAVSDQLLYELSRIADALDRIANRPVDQSFSEANLRPEDSRTIPLSMFGRERPLG